MQGHLLCAAYGSGCAESPEGARVLSPVPTASGSLSEIGRHRSDEQPEGDDEPDRKGGRPGQRGAGDLRPECHRGGGDQDQSRERQSDALKQGEGKDAADHPQVALEHPERSRHDEEGREKTDQRRELVARLRRADRFSDRTGQRNRQRGHRERQHEHRHEGVHERPRLLPDPTERRLLGQAVHYSAARAQLQDLRGHGEESNRLEEEPRVRGPQVPRHNRRDDERDNRGER